MHVNVNIALDLLRRLLLEENCQPGGGVGGREKRGESCEYNGNGTLNT